MVADKIVKKLTKIINDHGINIKLASNWLKAAKPW